MKKRVNLGSKFHHLYNQGVDKRMVFSTQGDFERFKACLYLLNDEESPRVANFFGGNRQENIYTSGRGNQLVGIGAYSIMPTHFHLVVTPLVENGIAKFMQKLMTAYTMYFNERTFRSGSLFQGTYRSHRVESDEHLKYLYSYIHFNSAAYFHDDWKEGSEADFRILEKNIATYPYSSAREFFSSQFIVTSPLHFPRYLIRAKDIESHLRYWMKFKNKFRELSERGVGII